MLFGSCWTCHLVYALCLCTSSRSDWGYGGLSGACSQWPGTSRIYFFNLALNSWKPQRPRTETFHVGRQKKFPTKMVTNLALHSPEVIYSLFSTYICIRQNFGLLGCNGSGHIPRHLTLLGISRQIMAWVVLMAHEGCESSSESLVREAVCWAMTIMLFNSQSNEVK